jgi:hypothetical protein
MTQPIISLPNQDHSLWTAGAVTGAPLLILRAEGAVLLVAAMAGYAVSGFAWSLFAILFLLPDVFMLGYLIDRTRGAALYNLGHSTVLPALSIGLGLFTGNSLATAVGLIWLAHVGFDRAMGYGLKYPDSFASTHLGMPIAPAHASTPAEPVT